MAKPNFCQLWLTCANKEEADKIAKHLLACPAPNPERSSLQSDYGASSSGAGVKHLVTCVRQIPGSSKYRWQGRVESSKEIFLEMLSSTDHFDEIEREVAKLHSYNTFVLTATPISKVSKKAEQWLKKELKNV